MVTFRPCALHKNYGTPIFSSDVQKIEFCKRSYDEIYTQSKNIVPNLLNGSFKVILHKCQYTRKPLDQIMDIACQNDSKNT